MLLFFGVLFAYCFIGTFIKSKLSNSSDVFYNNIPMRDFWFGLPGLATDGVKFVADTATGGGRSNYKKIGSKESDAADPDEAAPKE